MMRWFSLLGCVMLMVVVATSTTFGQATSNQKAEKKRVLLLGQSPDGHPRTTHEYMAGMRVLAAVLKQVPNLEVVVVKADDPWEAGPDLLRETDAVVLFVSEGAKWIHADARRIEAFAQMAANGAGLVCLHWGMGTKDARYIDGFLKLFGGCHGGPDRKYKVLDTVVQVAADDHPVVFGIKNFAIHEEFYYRLKLAGGQPAVTPILQTSIEGKLETVAWSRERPDGGRSFGYSGGHFHKHWQRSEYRRLMAQAVLWSLKMPIPKEGLAVDVDADVLKLPKTK